MNDERNPAAANGVETVLVIEASTTTGSLALLRGGTVVATRSVVMGASRDDALFPTLQAMLAEHGVAPAMLTRIVCGEGPGSFTSLRIAASLAKGLAHGSGARLARVSSLALSAVVALGDLPGDASDIVVHSDALRGERYVQRMRVDADRNVTTVGPVGRVPFAGLVEACRGALRVAVGSSPDPALEHAVVLPSAAAITAVHGWDGADDVSLEAWEPVYGRAAEAQVVWERAHGHALPV